MLKPWLRRYGWSVAHFAWGPLPLAAASICVSCLAYAWVWLLVLVAVVATIVLMATRAICLIAALVSLRQGVVVQRATGLALLMVASLTGLRCGDYVHLAVTYPHISSVIDTLPDSCANPVPFWWGEVPPATALDAAAFRTLVFDCSDATATSVGRSISRFEQGQPVVRDTRHLIGDFYLEVDTYQ